MSTDMAICAGIGYHIPVEGLDHLKKDIPEKYHYEPRWDSKTGKQLKDKKIFDDCGEELYFWDDYQFEDFSDFLEAITKSLNNNVSIFYDNDEGRVIFTLQENSNDSCITTHDDGSYDYNHINVCGDIEISNISYLEASLIQLKLSVEDKLSIKLNTNPRIYTQLEVS